MVSRYVQARLVPLLLALTAVAITVSVGGAAAGGGPGHAAKVKSNTDAAVQAKLSPDLQQQVADDATAPVRVVVSLDTSAVPAAAALVSDEHVASKDGVSLMIGSINATKLAKLASLAGVASVNSIDFKQTGTPTGTDPEVGNQPSLPQRQDLARRFRTASVPFSKAPPLRTSHFDQLKSMNVLDAKTHDFTGAWNAGFTGTGVTASVLDGGADWGHPDLIGTWQTWGDEADDPGWVGWPKAFDPYSTLVLLALGPDAVAQNLSWYTTTQSATCSYVDAGGNPLPATNKNALCSVTFATRTGPARNFSAPSGTNTHTYTFPASWTKSGTVKLTSHPDDYLLELYGERPAVLVTDPNVAGQYDTVYVDLNDDYSFADEKPVTKSSPVSYRDVNGDGYTDLSGGLLYYISDGHTTIPGGPTVFGDDETPASGDFLAWSGDFDPGIEGHGTLTASNVVGQGVINGKSPSFADLKSASNPNGTIPGMVIGGAPNAKLAPMGDVYFSFNFSTQFAYLLTSSYGVQVTSNSYGTSTSDNDGLDPASIEADAFGNATTPVFSTGNGAPGFGTVTAPAPVGGIQVGASTNFGSTGWDSIANYSQVTDNDVIEWSNRGPGANGRNGVDVVADGSYAPGDATLNTILDGRNAWVTWGGTSRSTPVTVGAVALIEQAYYKAHGSFPDKQTVKTILKSSANDLGYDSWIQGTGSVDAGKAVAAAQGTGATISPNEWRPGTTTDANGRARFPVTIAPGGSASQSFSIGGATTDWTVSDRVQRQYASDALDFTSAPLAQESTPNFDAPDYLINITDKIKAHPDADMVVIRATYDHNQFDGNNDNKSDQSWRLLAYDWTDVNHDGKLWTDANGNGVVNHTDLPTSSNIDNFADINFKKSEMEQGEYERFFYHRPGSNVLMGFINHPNQRMADGIYLGFQHSKPNPAIDQTHFKIEIDYYKNVDWSWVTETGSGNAFTASLTVPSDTPSGLYNGTIVATHGSQVLTVPVSVTVAPTIGQNSDGSFSQSLTFGGDDVAAAQADRLYNNGAFFGANDWTWRQESGDWRFFYFNVANTVPNGTLFLSDTTWDDPAPTDLDTLLFGPTVVPTDAPLIFGGGAGFSSIATVGASQNAYLGSGTWAFNTSTGGPEEVVAGPARKGPNAVVEHGVNFNGDKFNVPFKVTLGALSVNPTSVSQTAAADGTGSFDVTVNSSVALSGLSADAFGLSSPQSFHVQPSQDDQSEADPSSASAKSPVITIGDHASRATFTLPDVGAGEDIDEFVVYDANHDGKFTNDEIVGSSTGPAGNNESVSLTKPAAGDYQVWVYGFQVSAADHDAGNTVGVDVVQGRDITITNPPTGPLAANTPYTLHLTYQHATGTTPLKGELLLGPTVAPSAVTVPIRITPAS